MNGVLALDLDATPRSSIQRSIDKIASYPGTIIHSPFAHFSTDALAGHCSSTRSHLNIGQRSPCGASPEAWGDLLSFQGSIPFSPSISSHSFSKGLDKVYGFCNVTHYSRTSQCKSY